MNFLWLGTFTILAETLLYQPVVDLRAVIRAGPPIAGEPLHTEHKGRVARGTRRVPGGPNKAPTAAQL